MSEKLLNKVTEILNEEKWTRATLNSYTINNFNELDELLETVFEEKAQDDVRAVCTEHLHHTKNSIIALYISGIISLSRQIVDDANLISLISIFQDNHKWNIVEFLCTRILEYGENKFALKTLADCFDNENEQEKKYEVWQRLIKIDYEEAEIVKLLAEKKEEEGDIPSAVDLYKKAIHRFINKKLFTNIKEVWEKLILHSPSEIEFFYHAESKVAKSLNSERSVQLLEELYPFYKEKKTWDTAIDILKRILQYDPKNPWARKEITQCYEEKYVDHSNLDEYIRLSNLSQSWRNVHDAIADFEKHISFDAGNFVFHRSWGVGRIRTIKGDDITIDFVRKRDHKMSLKMAVNALTVLEKRHIWVLKSIWKKDKLKLKIKKDIPWALKVIIKSLNNAADIKKIKAELVPSILTASEWSTWSTQARNVLKTNSAFGILPDKMDHFMVRDHPISFEEKQFNKFKAEKDYFGRVQTLMDYLDNAEPDSEYFAEMFEYFVGFLRSFSEVNEHIISSALLVADVVKRYPFLNPGLEFDFKAYFNEIENTEDVFSKISDTELKRKFLEQIRSRIEDWTSYYKRLFPKYLNRYIIDELHRSGETKEIQSLFLSIFENYRDYREAFVWFAKNTLEEKWFQSLDVPYEKILIGMIHLLDISYREIDNRREVSLNRKINKQIHTFLFKEERVETYLLTADEESINRIYTLIADVKDLDPSIRIELKHKIIDKFPDFKFIGEEESVETVSRGFIVSEASYEAKQKELQHIHEVEVPNNSQEISEALQHGDLKENAEYKAAKERQEILNSTVAKLKEEIDKAQIVHVRDVNPAKVSFGTHVELENKISGENEGYTILGPWESNPDEKIISYLSPLGNELYNAEEGEELDFVINERDYSYKVIKIEVADF